MGATPCRVKAQKNTKKHKNTKTQKNHSVPGITLTPGDATFFFHCNLWALLGMGGRKLGTLPSTATTSHWQAVLFRLEMLYIDRMPYPVSRQMTVLDARRSFLLA